jgi:hypothetical protein
VGRTALLARLDQLLIALMTLAGGLAMGGGLYGLLFARRRGWMPAVIQGGALVGLVFSYLLMSMKPPARDEAPAVVGPTYTLFAIAAVLAFLVATWIKREPPPPDEPSWRRSLKDALKG